MKVSSLSGLMLTCILFQWSTVLGILWVLHREICTKNRVLLAENRLDFLQYSVSRCIKPVLKWHFLKEHFICSFSDLQLLQSWFLILICCTCLLALRSHCCSNSDLGKISPAISQLKCTVMPVFLVPSPATDISLHHLCFICLCLLPVFMAPCSMHDLLRNANHNVL